MVVTDTISDMITTIRNGILLSKESVKTPSSKLKINLLKILVTLKKYTKNCRRNL